MGCEELDQLIPDLRQEFNEKFTPEGYAALLRITEERCGVRVDFRIAETPVFLPLTMLEQMARSGARLAETLIGNRTYLDAARKAIPNGYHVAGETAHPNFLTADFALVREQNGELAPRLVEIQAFPSVFGYQDALSSSYREAFDLPASLGSFLGGLDEAVLGPAGQDSPRDPQPGEGRPDGDRSPESEDSARLPGYRAPPRHCRRRHTQP